MTRLGWSILAIILLATIGFLSLVSFGGASREPALVTGEPRDELPPAEAPGAPERLLVPVAGVPRTALSDDYEQERGGGTRTHRAIDIMAPQGTIVSAAAPGRIEKLFLSHDGGLTIYQRSLDRRTLYYYAHLLGYRRGLSEGQAVRAGEPIAAVGATGNADAAAPHLHFAVNRVAPGDRWWQGHPVNPYPLLAGSRTSR